MFIKIGLRGFSPESLVFVRVGIAAVVLLPLGWPSLGVLLPRWRSLLLVAALNSAVPFWLLSWAETELDSGLAAVIQAAAPLLTALLALAVDRSQRVTGVRLAGLVIGLAGVALLVGARPSGEVLPALAVVGTAVCYAAAALLLGRRLGDLPFGAVAFGNMLGATLLVLPFGLATFPREAPGWDATISIVALGTLGSGLAFVIYTKLIQEAGASRAILVTYLVPALALAYGAVFLDEPVTASALLGLALVLGGVALGARR
jgi:drug/metabolite transporter (DMT)-like permease